MDNRSKGLAAPGALHWSGMLLRKIHGQDLQFLYHRSKYAPSVLNLPYFLSPSETKSFLPIGDMFKVSYMNMSDSFMELSMKALNRRKNDAISNRSSISARLTDGQKADEKRLGAFLTYFEPMHFRGPTENGVKASFKSWWS